MRALQQTDGRTDMQASGRANGRTVFWNHGPEPFRMLYDTLNFAEKQRHCVEQLCGTMCFPAGPLKHNKLTLTRLNKYIF